MAIREFLYINIKGEKEVIGAFDSFDSVTAEGLKNIISKYADDIVQGAVLKAPTYSGRLLASINKRMGTDPEKPTGVISPSVRYGAMQEFGTGPLGAALNRSPRPPWHHYSLHPSYPPISKIKDWAIRHGIPPFLLARAIFRRGGIPPQPFLTPTVNGVETEMTAEIGSFLESRARALGFSEEAA
jgi:hypothetical protein